MSLEKNMKFGFTTGSCATAAAKAASYMLLSGMEKNKIEIITPKGIPFNAEIVDILREENLVSCAVIKDGGDDPDITTGCHVVATVKYADPEQKEFIRIDGGFGVGRVTKPGLDQKVGMAAINHVPREMIEKEVMEVCNLWDCKDKLEVIISVPEGLELSAKTFNPKLGIEGGISIIGTSGIVEPMSSQALLDTIRLELNQKKVLGFQTAIVAPGNYGQDFMKETYGYDLDKCIKCSNFIGDTVTMARELGFRRLLLIGHLGKLIKVSGGIMNTHSKYGDHRMEILSEYARKAGTEEKDIAQIMECISTEEAVGILLKAGTLQKTMEYVVEGIQFHLKKEEIQVEVITFTKEHGLLAQSSQAEVLLKDCERN